MREFPHVLQTSQDVQNCIAMVRLGQLPADLLERELQRIERANFINVPIRSTEGCTATVGFLNEAAVGMEVADNLRITAIQHIAGDGDDEAGGDAINTETILTFNRIVPGSITEISIPFGNAVEEMGFSSRMQFYEAIEATKVAVKAFEMSIRGEVRND